MQTSSPRARLSVIMMVAALATAGAGAVRVESVARAADTTVGTSGSEQVRQLPGSGTHSVAMSGPPRLEPAHSGRRSRPLAPASPVGSRPIEWTLPDAAVPIPTPPVSHDWFCPGLIVLVPREALNHALADPAHVAGFKQACNLSLPPGPHNPLRIDLGLQNPNLPYHPLFNGLAWRCGCR